MNKKIGRIIAAVAILLFLGLIFSFINAFTGNPLSAYIASLKIRDYAARTYPTLNLKLSETKYNFKDGAYGCHAEAKDSEDTQFYIAYRRGVVSDDYAYEVANHFTTYRRLSHDFNEMVSAIIEEEFPHETTLIIGDLSGDTEALPFDGPLNLKTMPLPLTLTVYILSDVQDEEAMAAILIELNELMVSRQIPIDQYTLCLQEPLPEESKPGSGRNLYLTDFPAKDITGDQATLAAAIKGHQLAMSENEK